MSFGLLLIISVGISSGKFLQNRIEAAKEFTKYYDYQFITDVCFKGLYAAFDKKEKISEVMNDDISVAYKESEYFDIFDSELTPKTSARSLQSIIGGSDFNNILGDYNPMALELY